MTDEAPRVALICAPFGACDRPALGVSLLKSTLVERGIRADVHYLNLALAREIGMGTCDWVGVNVLPTALLGEWLFAPALSGDAPDADDRYVRDVLWREYPDAFTPDVVLHLLRVRERLPAFLDACVERIDWSRYDWAGFSTSGPQNCASLALARRLRVACPGVRIAFGGANCFGDMGVALARAFPFIDYVCTGYGEVAFPDLVQSVAQGAREPGIAGMVARAGPRAGDGTPPPEGGLDALPWPDFSDYFAQLEGLEWQADHGRSVVVEASRGCWWGDRTPCTFCGLNTTGRAFRRKTPERVVAELRGLAREYEAEVLVADVVLDPDYLGSVMPELARRGDVTLGLEAKTTLSREDVRSLAAAGVAYVQAGIESLSDRVLRLMRKGTTVARNVQVLKWARQYGIHVSWNLLWGFPGETAEDYEHVPGLIRLLAHLQAPNGYGHLHFDRFSAYWEEPAGFGIAALRPAPAYPQVYHRLSDADLHGLAYYFEADYDDLSEAYAGELRRAVGEWQKRDDAVLDAVADGDAVVLVDTRVRGKRREERLGGAAAQVYLLCDAARTADELCREPALNDAGAERIQALLDGFVEQGLMLHTGGRYLSLAVWRGAAGA